MLDWPLGNSCWAPCGPDPVGLLPFSHNNEERNLQSQNPHARGWRAGKEEGLLLGNQGSTQAPHPLCTRTGGSSCVQGWPLLTTARTTGREELTGIQYFDDGVGFVDVQLQVINPAVVHKGQEDIEAVLEGIAAFLLPPTSFVRMVLGAKPEGNPN